MTAIRAAFERHEIHCATPAVGEQRLRGRALARPPSRCAQDRAIAVSWTAVAGAAALRRLPRRGRRTAAPSARSRSARPPALPSWTGPAERPRRTTTRSCPWARTLLLRPHERVRHRSARRRARTSRSPASTHARRGGDGDAFLDNCETATVTFTVENTGPGPLTNVRLVSVTPVTHPPTVRDDAARPHRGHAGGCATANGSFSSSPRAWPSTRPRRFRIDDHRRRARAATRTRLDQRLARRERRSAPVATRTYDFDADLDGWTISAGPSPA